MKKLIALSTLLLLFAAGCQTDISADLTTSERGAVLNVSLAPTRVSLGGKVGATYSAYWNEGDRLAVNGKESGEAIIDAEDRSKATFEFSEQTTLSYPFNITYPYCAVAAEQAMVEFPAKQNYAEGSFEVGSAPMCGYVAMKGDAVTLKHLAAILHFPVKAKCEGVILDKIVITSKSKIAGLFEVECQNATISATADCENVVIYSLPANYTLSTTSASNFFIALPAVNVGTCEIEFVDASGEKMVALWSPSAPLSKGVVREFDTITYQPKSAITLPSMQEDVDTLIFSYKKYAGSNELKIMSFNVRTTASESDPANNWDNRKEACVRLLKDQKPSIIGYQEAKYTAQWLYLKEQLADRYDGYGVNRDTGAESGTGEVMGIMYDRYVVEKIDGGTFWLSETPDTPSKGFGASYSRNATWGLFKHLPTGQIFYYINTHLDHKVANAQIEGMKLISKYFEEYKDTYPLFLTGDLNVSAENVAIDPIEGYMHNARVAAPLSLSDFDNTYNGWTLTGKHIIDHIYCSNNLQVVEYHTVNESYGVPFVSDHYPIYAIVKLK